MLVPVEWINDYIDLSDVGVDEFCDKMIMSGSNLETCDWFCEDVENVVVGKIEKIEPLRNLETPKYFALIKRDLLGKWNGLAVKKASQQQVDVITGATYSSEAVIENVRRGLDYYTKKGKK